MKQQLVEVEHGAPRGDRARRADRGRRQRVPETEPSPLTGGDELDHDGRSDDAEARPDRAAQSLARRARQAAVKPRRSPSSTRRATQRRATSCRRRSPAAKAGVTTGEWGGTLREVFGEYRAPTGVGRAMRNDVEQASTTCAARSTASRSKLGRRLTFLVGKPGLDGHSNGAEQIAVRARDAGMRGGLRRHPPHAGGDRRRGARAEGPRHRPVDPLGLRMCRWSKTSLQRMKKAGLDMSGRGRRHHSAGGRRQLDGDRRRRVYTPKDFELNQIMTDVVRIVERKNGVSNV